MRITYAITVCNEWWQLKRLLETLQPFLLKGDQVLIQSDSSSVTDSVVEVINNFTKQYSGSGYGIKHNSVALNNDFSSFKNKIFDQATGDYIFQIDADEYPTESLLSTLRFLIENNEDTELVLVPRINTVDGITEDHLNKWRWKISKMEHPTLLVTASREKLSDGNYQLLNKYDFIKNDDGSGELSYYQPVINFPDYQFRLYRNVDHIRWENRVHERLVGFGSYSELPAHISYSLIHDKDIVRQEKQNKFYDKLI